MKISHLHLLLNLLCLPLFGISQIISKEVPLNHEQIVLNDKILFSITGMQKVDSIKIFADIIKPEEGNQLVVVKLNYTGKIPTKWVLRPTDFVAMYDGGLSIYIIPSTSVRLGKTWITNEFDEKYGKMSVKVDVKPDVVNDDLEVLFKLPNTVTAFSVMSRTLSSLGYISITK